MNESKDDPRDAHLLAALRHAPDRDAVPPREISERILAAARAAAQSSRAAVRPRHVASAPWWQRLSAWLMQPQVAASFGTLAVASIVGVMWSTREPPVAEFTPPPAMADRLEQRPLAEAPLAAPQPEAAKPDADGAATAPAAIGQARPPAAPLPRPKQAPAKDAAARSRSALEAPAAPADNATTATPSAAPPPPAAVAPTQQAADAAVSAPAAAAERRAATASESRVMELRREAAPRPASAAAMGMSLTAKANAAADPLARWDAALGADASASVLWRLGDRRDAPPLAHGAAQARWWAALRRATDGAWQARTRDPSPPPSWLAFDVSGASAGSIDLAGDGVLLCPTEGAACWRAPITPAQRDAWIAEIARW